MKVCIYQQLTWKFYLSFLKEIFGLFLLSLSTRCDWNNVVLKGILVNPDESSTSFNVSRHRYWHSESEYLSSIGRNPGLAGIVPL